MDRVQGVTKQLLIAALGISCAAVHPPVVAAERPNILLVVGDDVGWGDLRTNSPVGKVSLPTIERLAREGISFTDAHTSAAKCAPSRYSIITGNYQWRGRLSWGTWKYKGGSQVLAGQETLGGLLKRAGYTTAIIGKYNLAANFYKKNSNSFATVGDLDTSVDFTRAMVDGPNGRGFDYSFVAMMGIQAGPYAFFENGILYGDPSKLMTWKVGDYGDTQILVDGIGLPNWVTRDVGPTLATKALDFIEAQHHAQAEAAEPKPFFLYLDTQAVHSPRKPPVSIGGRSILGTTGLGARTDMLVEIDAIVDALIQRLDQLALLDDTLIVFSSDNGGLNVYSEQRAGHQTSGGFRGDKGTIYEGGHRVPLIIKWGQQGFGSSPHPAGTVINSLVGIHDLYATLAELTGVPAGADQGRDSLSFLSVLMGQAAAARADMVQEADEGEDNASDGGISGRHFAYRSGSWKLVFNSSRSPVGLYDLALDPFETTNLLTQPAQSDRVAAMRAGLEASLVSDRTTPPIGTAPLPAYALSLTSLSFGSQPVNVSSTSQAISLSNTGSVELPITSIAKSGANPSQFIQANDCGSSVPVSSNCTITILFKPTSTGTKTASITVTTGGGAGTKSVALSGAGVTNAISTFSLSPTTLAFGNVTVGVTSAAMTVVVLNNGTAALPITSIRLGGTNHAQFSHTHDCPAQLAIGAGCTVSVAFKPKSKNAKSATLKVTPGGGATAKTVALSGTGI